MLFSLGACASLGGEPPADDQQEARITTTAEAEARDVEQGDTDSAVTAAPGASPRPAGDTGAADAAPAAPAPADAASAAGGDADSADPDANAPQRAVTGEEPVKRVVIHAPGGLEDLLNEHLDLTRALRLPDQQDITPVEWTRLTGTVSSQAQDLLRTRGYFNSQVEVSRRGDTVTLDVDPGTTVRVGRVDFELLGAIAEEKDSDDYARRIYEETVSSWALPTGTPFTQDAWSSAKNAVLARLRAAGYAVASFDGTAAEVDPSTDEVRIVLVADSGPLFRAGDIRVTGLKYHTEDEVKRLAGFDPGTPLSEDVLLEYQERLRTTYLYDQVLVSYNKNPEKADAARVRVRVVESKLQQAQLAVGYDFDNGPRVKLDYTHRQPFGLPLTSRNQFVLSPDEQSLDTELSTRADENFRRKLVGLSVLREKTSSDLTVAQALRLGIARDTPRLDRLTYLLFEHSKECDYDNGATSNCIDIRAASLNWHTTLRHLDNNLLPTTGWALNTQVGAGGAQSNGERGPYGRLYGRLTGYWPMGGWFGEARIELGQVFVSDRVTVPESQRFRAGGAESVRGYEYRGLSPETDTGRRTGGKSLFTTSLEIARPITPKIPSVWWAMFVDAGRAADSFGELTPAVGYGAGVRWRSPVGPLKLDLAYGQEVKKFRLHLSVGVTF